MEAVSIKELAANSGSSWISEAPNLHFARQLLMTFIISLISPKIITFLCMKNVERKISVDNLAVSFAYLEQCARQPISTPELFS